MRIIQGDSTRGFNHAKVTKTKRGKLRLIKGSEVGSKTIIKKCVANYNRGQMFYVTSAGDELPFKILPTRGEYNLFNEQGAFLDSVKSINLDAAKEHFLDAWELKPGCYISNQTTGEIWKNDCLPEVKKELTENEKVQLVQNLLRRIIPAYSHDGSLEDNYYNNIILPELSRLKYETLKNLAGE